VPSVLGGNDRERAGPIQGSGQGTAHELVVVDEQ